MNQLTSRIKFLGKQTLWELPTPVSRTAISLACAAGILNPAYRAYQRLGRPERVLSGPFEGMRYIPIALGSSWLPKIVGSYEKELQPAWDRLRSEGCDVFIDIGSAEGYYAVGLARTFDIPRMLAFDPDPNAAESLPKLAALNGVSDKITLGGFCHTYDLEASLEGATHPWVLCDCEGGELDLIDLAAVPSLRHANLVVEVHDYFGADKIGSAIRERFAESHEITPVPIATRTLDDFPEVLRGKLSDADALAAMWEFRPPVAGWLLLWPKAKPSHPGPEHR